MKLKSEQEGKMLEDARIVDLYWDRDESAITQTDIKYRSYCFGISYNLLSRYEDAEECINDTWLAAWNAMPEERPDNLKAWLGRVVRNISISLWTRNHRQKRYSGIETQLDELAECIPSPQTVEKIMEDRELTDAITDWLGGLSADSRVLFIRRYWYSEQVKDLANEWHITPKTMAQRLRRLRLSLKESLEKEGISI